MNIYDSIITQSEVSTTEHANKFICLKRMRFISKAKRNCEAQRGDVIDFKESPETAKYIDLMKQLGYIANANQITDGLRQYVFNSQEVLDNYGLTHLKVGMDFFGIIPVFIVLPKDVSNMGENYRKIVENEDDLSEFRQMIYTRNELRKTEDDVKYKNIESSPFYPNFDNWYKQIESRGEGEPLSDYHKELLQY